MMDSPTNLPPEFDALLVELAGQPPAVHEIFQYALTLMLIDDEKAVEVGRRQADSREWLHMRTISGDEFEVVVPRISEELEKVVLAQIRQIVAEDGERI
ncbi:MAG: hypothetical protein WCF84_18785 [Anaerolineae bacterium]